MSEFVSEYRNSPGVHHFETSAGQAVDVVSANDWESFECMLRTAEFSPGSIALSPELMTSPVPLRDIPTMGGVISRRLVSAQLFSASFPDTSLLLGSATHRQKIGREIGDEKIPDLLNSLVFIKDIVRTGIAHKRRLFHLNELAVFDDVTPDQPYGLSGRGIATLVSSDLIMAAYQAKGVKGAKVPYIDDQAHTVLVSSCWTGQFPPVASQVDEKRFREPLEQTAGMVFDSHPAVNDIVMADRVAPNRVKQPFNVHFRRTSQ